MTQRDNFAAEIDRLLHSNVLQGSESLCRLLQYLARHAQEHPGVPLKEYQIATEVFGRPADFDPQVDSAIRVQAGRLRAKLAEYYAHEGAEDAVIVELPKGSYALHIQHRAPAIEAKGNGAMPATVAPAAAPPASSPSWAVPVLSLLLAAALLALVWTLNSHKPAETALAVDREPPAAALQMFWKSFTSGPEEPWVVFSNAAFVGRPETGMRYFNKAQDSQSVVWDHYTGVGEVLAVHSLDQVFASLHRQLRVKRGSLFSLDDVTNNDLIFVGSPSENLTLLDIPTTQEFVFQRLASGPRKGDLAVVNSHPQRGEPKAFVASPSASPLTDDYAVIGLVPGLNPKRTILILAGTTTFGTQAAVEFVCRPNSVEQLLNRLPKSPTGDLEPFEALLHVSVKRGVPVETELLSVRKR